ncbi:hypothetical protein M2347_000118 [Chryseobacterium sp. H1D6B]|uniref:cytochrome C551 n=1 Tax=Chryseobacterium sp. H1D6B TaxID=2940588 RepID=UPI0015CA6BE2|nr:cytochrome C551 [Chryseobacterium sp. H1D6B]MDH6250391.1 hypothetical protein [Chryseobacterium sp. H1D6B]
MKKLLLLTLGLGIFAVSCGTKESQMSSSKTDSTKVQSIPPETKDTVVTANPDSQKMKMDSAAVPATK